MRAIQRINHNAAICEDGAGRQLIALGRGIGFGDMPHEVDLDVITRTFYGIDPKYLAFIDEVDPEVLEFSAQLADIATGQLSYELSPNLPITLADHIQFAIKRAREHMVVSLPLKRDLEQLHPIEYRLGELAVRGIKKTFAVRMPQSEAAGIAMSIINAAIKPSERRVLAEQHEEHLLDMTVAIIQEELGVTVDRSSFAFTRFATHVRYLLDRVAKKEPIDTENSGLYDVLVEQYPAASRCAHRIDDLIQETFGEPLAQEELVYLIMHVNRVAPASLNK